MNPSQEKLARLGLQLESAEKIRKYRKSVSRAFQNIQDRWKRTRERGERAVQSRQPPPPSPPPGGAGPPVRPESGRLTWEALEGPVERPRGPQVDF